MRQRPLSRELPAGLLAAALLSTGCTALDGGRESILDTETLVIGVKGDQPGLGERTGEGEFEGFDVDVARYIAEELGFGEEQIRFVETPSAVREYVLMQGDVEEGELPELEDEGQLPGDALGEGEYVDMVVATYSITPERRQSVNFAGPYYVAQQDILVAADNQEVSDVRDLAGQQLCQGEGSNSGSRVVEERGVDAELVELGTYSECTEALVSGEVDAVSTDNLILAGFALAQPEAFRVVNAPFTSERYGVGLAQSDVAGCEEVNRIITGMYREDPETGSSPAAEMLQEWFGETDLEITTTVPQFEGCG